MSSVLSVQNTKKKTSRKFSFRPKVYLMKFLFKHHLKKNRKAEKNPRDQNYISRISGIFGIFTNRHPADFKRAGKSSSFDPSICSRNCLIQNSLSRARTGNKSEIFTLSLLSFKSWHDFSQVKEGGGDAKTSVDLEDGTLLDQCCRFQNVICALPEK